MLSDKLKALITQKEIKSSKFAEKILIGYKSIQHSLKHVVLYRIVSELHSPEKYIANPHRDSEGYWIGIKRDLIYEDMDVFKSCVEKFTSEGWVIETQSCNEQALLILSGDIVDESFKKPYRRQTEKQRAKWKVPKKSPYAR